MKAPFFMLLFCGVLASGAFAQSDSADSVLIVKGDSFFEDTVVSYVKKRLAHDALYTRIVRPEEASDLVQGNFAVVVLLHAVDAYKISAAYGPFVNNVRDGSESAKVLVCNISGELWKEGTVVDGISGATKPYRPEQVGKRLYSQIRSVIDAIHR